MTCGLTSNNEDRALGDSGGGARKREQVAEAGGPEGLQGGHLAEDGWDLTLLPQGVQGPVDV